ncbi:MAG TPA: DUF58 domain-containing protein, partial [Roseiflexaceae bacterium]|nr:DUF58 domain-containing protein [Roseiflexaceae bacterium]
VDAHEERPLVSAAQLDVTWLHRGEEVAQAGRALEAALRAELLPAGDERSRRRGAGMELSEVRAYQPGDDIRFIDWNITARTDQSYVREATVERALDVWMVVDSPIPARPPLRGGRAGRCRGLRLPRPQPGGFSNRL